LSGECRVAFFPALQIGTCEQVLDAGDKRLGTLEILFDLTLERTDQSIDVKALDGPRFRLLRDRLGSVHLACVLFDSRYGCGVTLPGNLGID